MNALQTRLLAKCDRIVGEGLAAMASPYLSCSWGKDSTFLLWLVLRHRPDIPVVFVDSGYAMPDTYAIRDRLLREWGPLRYTEVPSAVDYLELVRTWGLPDVSRKDSDQQRVVRLLKKDPMTTWAHQHGYDGIFWGMRADESAPRRAMCRYYGATFHASSADLWRCAPLAWLTGHELWYLIDSLALPYNGLYDKTLLQPRELIRNGGWLTTDGARSKGRLVWLRYYYPDLYGRLADMSPEVSRLA